MSAHDLTLIATSGAAGAYLVLLAAVINSIRDDKRNARQTVTAKGE